MVMYEFSCDYVDTDGIIVDIKTKVSYSNIAKVVERRPDTSNYQLNRSLTKGKIGLDCDKLRGKNLLIFATLRPKTYNYLADSTGKYK